MKSTAAKIGRGREPEDDSCIQNLTFFTKMNFYDLLFVLRLSIRSKCRLARAVGKMVDQKQFSQHAAVFANY